MCRSRVVTSVGEVMLGARGQRGVTGVSLRYLTSDRHRLKRRSPATGGVRDVVCAGQLALRYDKTTMLTLTKSTQTGKTS